MSHARYCILGNISIDDLVFEDGSTMWRVPGGNSIYSALGAALWRERPAVIAPVGPEYPREAIGDRIDLSRCRPLDRTLRDWGLYEEDGSRIFVFRSKTKNWLEFSPTPADLVDFSCDFAHLAPLRWELQIDLIGRLRADGAQIVSVDPDDRYLAELDHATMMRLLNAIDLFLPSKQDIDALMPGKTPQEALRALRRLAPDLPVIALKRGEQGVLMHSAGAKDYFEIPTSAEIVVDATGAGDAFCGGALVGYARTQSPIEAVLWGSVSASFAIAAMGPTGLVGADYDEAQSRIERLRLRLDAHPL
jgi:sugar/nucleoside kinase (ribokinase family)